MWLPISYYAFSGLFNFSITLIFAFLLFFNAKFSSNKIFALLSIAVAQWSLFYFLWLISPDETFANFFIRTCMIGVCFMPSLFIHFVILLFEIPNRKKFIILNYLISTSFACTVYTPLYAREGSKFLVFPYWPSPSITCHLSIIYFGTMVSYAIYLIYSDYRNSKGIQRTKNLYLLIGTSIGFIAGATNFFSWYRIPIPPFLNIFVSLYVIIISYAIIRYRLMDINIAIRNILSYSIEIIILSFSLFLVFGAFGFKEILPLILSSFGIAAGLIPLRNLIKRFIDKIIFRGKYNYQKALTDITNVIPTIIDQDKLLKYITNKITECMHIEKAVIFIKDERQDVYLPQYSIGLNGQAEGKTINGKSPLINWLKHNTDIALKYELYHTMPQNEVNQLWSEVKPFDSELVVPLRKGENILGFLCLSYKGGGDIFNQDDFRILQTIANESAVVIENIRLYNKLIHSDRQTFLETLASGVSHEMRNRLVAIRTFIDLFPERVDLNHVEKGYIEFRELAVREMERLTKIIDGLLNYSRAVTIGGEPLNMNDLLEEALLIIQPKLKEKEITLGTNYDKNIPVFTGDKGRLLQVFINIMQNGIDAMQKGGKLKIKSVDKTDFIEVSITDNGKGIPKEHLDAIFEPFFTTKHTGTGLGLSIVQRIVRDHSGTINVASEINKGTTFTVAFSKKGGYKPADIAPKEGMKYWDVKKEYEIPEKDIH